MIKVKGKNKQRRVFVKAKFIPHVSVLKAGKRTKLTMTTMFPLKW